MEYKIENYLPQKTIDAPDGKYANEHLEPYVEGQPYFQIKRIFDEYKKKKTLLNIIYEWKGCYTRKGWNGSFNAEESFLDVDHRIDGPSNIMVHPESKRIWINWRQNGVRHNLKGPAYAYADHKNSEQTMDFYIFGKICAELINPFRTSIQQRQEEFEKEKEFTIGKEFEKSSELAAEENQLHTFLNKVLERAINQDKADKIKVLMDMCAEWGL